MNKKQYTPEKLDYWCLPIELAQNVKDRYFALLYSSTKNNNSGRYSFLACDLREKITSSDINSLGDHLSSDQNIFDNAWFGYLGYGLKNSLENLPEDKKNLINLPDLYMMKFGSIYRFDHEKQEITLWKDSKNTTPLNPVLDTKKTGNKIPEAKITGSNMTDIEYLQKVKKIIENIEAGDLYQANLTRKFYGELLNSPDYDQYFNLFCRLCEVSPSAYSAFIRLGDDYIISSSPESFINIDGDGNVTTSPIKGTIGRGINEEDDKQQIKKLKESEKDRAENLMIVDLMRNDLAKTCETGSVVTKNLFDVTNHTTIHHMSSTVCGKRSKGMSTLDVIKAAFPAGSMTGAPKISAMKLCSKLEQLKRGVYSGAIGWFGGDGSCDLSVVIRTIIIQGKIFEFQVGGGIVADSIPEKELEETFVKAKGILLALNIPQFL